MTAKKGRKVKTIAYLTCIMLWMGFLSTLLIWQARNQTMAERLQLKTSASREIRDLAISYRKMESSARAYYFTHNDAVLDSYNAEKKGIQSLFDNTKKVVLAADSDEVESFNEMNKLYSEWFSFTEKGISYIRTSTSNADELVKKDVYERKTRIDKIDYILHTLMMKQDSEYDALTKTFEDSQRVFWLILMYSSPVFSISIYLLLLLVAEASKKEPR